MNIIEYTTTIDYSIGYAVNIEAPDTLTVENIEEFLQGFIEYTNNPNDENDLNEYICCEYKDDPLLDEYKKIEMFFDCVKNDTYINEELNEEK